MCLFTRQIKPKVFTKDRVFYKVLYLRNGEYYTPFTDSKVTIGDEIQAEGQDKFVPKSIANKTNLVFAGYIHLLIKFCDAYELTKRLIIWNVPLEKMKVDEVIVVRAIVPAGTEYYSGFDGNYYGSVAVKKVKYELV